MKLKTKKLTENITGTKSRLFEEINKIDKYLARLTKKKGEKTQMEKYQK